MSEIIVTAAVIGVAAAVVEITAQRYRRHQAARCPQPPGIIVRGIENLDREPGATRAITIGGHHFVAMDDYVHLLLHYAHRMDEEGRHDRAAGARDVAGHLGGWVLDLDLEAVEKSRP